MTNEAISYKSAQDELEQIMQDIESGNIEVEELAAKVQRASFLISTCREKLRSVEQSVEDILENMDQGSDASGAEEYPENYTR